MENLGIYCRVSSKYQENDGNSIDYQLKDGESISKKLGMKPIIFNEGGKTSWDSNINVRPQLVKMLNEIESKNLTSIWCWNMDRLGRNSESWWTILKILVGWKVNLYVGDSIKPFDFSNPTDRLVTGVLTLISTYDNELRRIRMIFGKMEALRKGQTYIGGTITFGYSSDKNNNLIPNSSEKKVLKKIFQMYSDDKSTTDIKVMLDNSNHNPKYSKKGWNVGTIQKMLGNQIYIGKQVWNWKEKEPDGSETIIESIEIETPKLIGKNLFDDVRKRLNKYKKHNQYDTDLKSLLKGLLICGHCKLPMNHRMKQREKHQYYYCVYNERRWGKSNKGKYSKKSCEMKRSLIISQSDDLFLSF